MCFRWVGYVLLWRIGENAKHVAVCLSVLQRLPFARRLSFLIFVIIGREENGKRKSTGLGTVTNTVVFFLFFFFPFFVFSAGTVTS